MKKFIAIALLCLSLPVCAETIQGSVSQNVFAPQWSDVCTWSAYWDIDVNKNYKKAEKKYWKERRIQFNKQVLACEQTANVSDCYQAIIALEAERTQKWEDSYKDERKQRAVKTAGTVGTVGVLGGLTALILNIIY